MTPGLEALAALTPEVRAGIRESASGEAMAHIPDATVRALLDALDEAERQRDEALQKLDRAQAMILRAGAAPSLASPSIATKEPT